MIVQDLFLTETAQLVDVVLPAAGWREKTGIFTNVSRTVHLSEKAVDPPGDAKSDLDIFIMYADATSLSDRDGAPLIGWRTPEEAFDAWREATRGRPVDYTGLSYDKLRGPTGIAWPVNDQAPEGTDRLYTDPVFPTHTDQCETYGHDLLTGGAVTEQEHRAMAPSGRAFLKGCVHTPAHEEPSEQYGCTRRHYGVGDPGPVRDQPAGEEAETEMLRSPPSADAVLRSGKWWSTDPLGKCTDGSRGGV